MTIWKDVKDFEGFYEVNNFGVVRSLNRLIYHPGNNKYHYLRGKILTTRTNNYGYVSIRLSKNGKTYTRFQHRLIAEAFIPNPIKKKCVNHIDGVKTNNTIENLEWTSHSENMIHAYSNGLIKKSIWIYGEDVKTNNRRKHGIKKGIAS